MALEYLAKLCRPASAICCLWPARRSSSQIVNIRSVVLRFVLVVTFDVLGCCDLVVRGRIASRRSGVTETVASIATLRPAGPLRSPRKSAQGKSKFDSFLARDSIYAIARYMPSPVRLAVRLAVCPSHGWISQRRLKLGLRNLHHRVAP